MREIEENQKELKDLDKIEDKLLFTITGITWVAAIAALGAMLTNNIGTALFISFTIAFITGFLVKPLIVLVRESSKRLISFTEKYLLGVKGFIVFMGILCGYIIFVSPYYDLYWSYWGLILSFLLLLLMDFFKKKNNKEEAAEEEESRKSRFKKIKKAAYVMFSFLLTLPNFYQLYTKEQVITLEDLATPSYIQAREIDKIEAIHGSGAFAFQEYETIHINEEEILSSLIEELEGVTVENIRYIQGLNYSKMKRIEAPYYKLYVHYKQEDGVGIFGESFDREKKGEKKRSYIYGLEIYPNGRAYLKLATEGRTMLQMFPVNISDEVIQKLLGSSMI